jgi:16S rRNA (guanine966-N2)-methyltransferase
VVLVERHPLAVALLRENVDRLAAEKVSVHAGDVMAWLQGQAPAGYDLLFADPPFAEHLHAAVLDAVVRRACLKPGGLLYLEAPAAEAAPPTPAGWEVHKEKRIGDVRLQLFRTSVEAA